MCTDITFAQRTRINRRGEEGRICKKTDGLVGYKMLVSVNRTNKPPTGRKKSKQKDIIDKLFSVKVDETTIKRK